MAVNPTLAEDSVSKELFPLHQSGEAFALKRDNIDFECILPRGKLWGKGCFFLSSKRIVFVCLSKSCRADFKSFEIPLATLLEPKFNQPIFGANYLSGLATPTQAGGPLGGSPAAWSLTFNSGGCGTFLPLFYRLLAELQEASQASSGSSVAQAAQDGRLGQVAYVDPSDPSVLFLSQPAAAPNSAQETVFEPSAPPPESDASEGAAGQRPRHDSQNCVCS
mmetsp:Transcript_115195/g.372688  ORF Transcript_115195/g.372688 Transcript_115195/m.372688 type:complete len:221 (+) Transcript_115195:94-756(+)